MRVLKGIVVVCLAVAGASPANANKFGAALSAAAIERTQHRVTYDPAYTALAYPGGDVATDRGVCADVIIRALRGANIDLQKLVHEDMQTAFSAYPDHWGLKRPDANIDHRRVPNLEAYFTRRGARLAPSTDPTDYLARRYCRLEPQRRCWLAAAYRDCHR